MNFNLMYPEKIKNSLAEITLSIFAMFFVILLIIT
jgi:hypothetical protein